MKRQRKIVFVSTMSSVPWGGSELLWSQAALSLLREGHDVAASVTGWPKLAAQVSALRQAGVRIQPRWLEVSQYPSKSWRRLAAKALEPIKPRAIKYVFTRWLARQEPDLTCFSNGGIGDYLGLMRCCMLLGKPYSVIAHANSELWWPSDGYAQMLIPIYKGARRVFFVSEGNRRLLEMQLGIELANAEVVRNPINVCREASSPWPGSAGPVRLACVGRLEPGAKGQDLLLQVLTAKPWHSREIVVSFFGQGDGQEGLRRLVRRFGLAERVRFCGHVDKVEKIWADHHALVLPSRYEGLPLAVVEAMFCGRPVIVTDVAGNSELVEDGVTGFIAEAPTVRHLQAALERAWQNQHRWEAMGRAAAQAARAFVPKDPGGELAAKLLDLCKS